MAKGNHRWRVRHWTINPRCHWCGVVTVLEVDKGPGYKERIRRLATIDHLRTRFDPTRYERANGDARRVLACSECNHRRGKEDQKRQQLTELHRRSGRGLQ